jgi:hypothetical protein
MAALKCWFARGVWLLYEIGSLFERGCSECLVLSVARGCSSSMVLSFNVAAAGMCLHLVVWLLKQHGSFI